MFVAGSGMRTADLSALHRNIHYRVSSCVLLTICVVCACIIVVCWVVVAREYALSSEYEPTTCRLTSVNYTGGEGEECTYCSGDKGSKNKDKAAAACITTHFPCLQLDVTYDLDLALGSTSDVTNSNGSSSRSSSRYLDALMHVDSLQAIGPHSKCSYSVCHRTYEENSREIGEYATVWWQLWQANKSFQCFYNTFDQGRVIAIKKYSRSDVIHGFAWPTGVIIVCGIIFLRLETIRRGYTCCGVKDVPPTHTMASSASSANQNSARTASGTFNSSSKKDMQFQQRGNASINSNGLNQPANSSSRSRSNSRLSQGQGQGQGRAEEESLLPPTQPPRARARSSNSTSSSSDIRQSTQPQPPLPASSPQGQGHVVAIDTTNARHA